MKEDFRELKVWGKRREAGTLSLKPSQLEGASSSPNLENVASFSPLLKLLSSKNHS